MSFQLNKFACPLSLPIGEVKKKRLINNFSCNNTHFFSQSTLQQQLDKKKKTPTMSCDRKNLKKKM